MATSRVKFFTVSLPNNLPTLQQSIPLLNKYYGEVDFFVVCPDSAVEKFASELACYSNVKIFNESQLVSLKEFRGLIDAYLGNTGDGAYSICEERVGWYYQQALKLAFVLENDWHDAQVVMWDADSVPLRRIEFSENGSSLLYGSRIEFHKPYFETIARILGPLPEQYKAFTIQFFSLTSSERTFLYEKLSNYCPKPELMGFGRWVSGIIIESVLSSHRRLGDSLFSEQELVGLSNMLLSHKKQVPITHLRFVLTGILSPRQLALVRLFGFVHVTYEQPDLLFRKRQSYGVLFAVIIKEYIRQNVLHHFLM